MRKDRENTRSFGIKAMLENGEPKLVKLAKSPLAPMLIDPNHLPSGVQNVLHDFDERLEIKLLGVDREYRTLMSKKRTLDRVLGNKDLKDGLRKGITKIKKVVEAELIAERARILPKVTAILVEAFMEAFAFVAEHLNDQRMVSMKLHVRQISVERMLEDHMDYYEDYYGSGADVGLRVLEYVRERDSRVGETVFLEVAPVGRFVEGSAKTVQTLLDASGRPKTLLPLVRPAPVEARPHVETLKPPALVRMSEEEIQAGARVAHPEEVTVASASAERALEKIPAAAVNQLPDLRDLFDDVEAFVEGSGALNEVSEVTVVMAAKVELVAPVMMGAGAGEISKSEGQSSFAKASEGLKMSKEGQKEDGAAQKVVEVVVEVPMVLKTVKKEKTVAGQRVVRQERPVVVAKQSWFGRMGAAASENVGAGWGWMKRKFQRFGKVAVLAGGLAAASAALVSADSGFGSHKDDLASVSKNSDKNPQVSPSANAAPSASASVEVAETPVVAAVPQIETKTARTTFARSILDSKSPLVQDIIHKGEVKLGTNGVTDAMIDSFKGLANADQSKELNKLRTSINLGLAVYFNEHFGTDAKTAVSMKDAGLRNLHRTAKVAREKGWFQSNQTKERFPQAYALAERILADSSVLGIDESDNPDQTVKNYVRGNMFQAKLPEDTVHLRKTDGSYHVIQEMVFRIFEGQRADDMMEARFGDAARGQNKVKAGGAAVDSGKTGVILPNIYFQKFQTGRNQAAVSDQDKMLAEIDGGWDAAPATEQDKMLAEVDGGWDGIETRQDKLALERSGLEKNRQVEIDLPLEYTTRQENEAIVPAVAEKMAEMYAQADGALVKKMIRQYGWMGLRLMSRGRGHFIVELNANFYKNILRPILQKRVAGRAVA